MQIGECAGIQYWSLGLQVMIYVKWIVPKRNFLRSSGDTLLKISVWSNEASAISKRTYKQSNVQILCKVNVEPSSWIYNNSSIVEMGYIKLYEFKSFCYENDLISIHTTSVETNIHLYASAWSTHHHHKYSIIIEPSTLGYFRQYIHCIHANIQGCGICRI